MNNALKVIAFALLGVGVFASYGAWQDNVSARGWVGFENEYVFRGHRVTTQTIVTGLEGSYKLYNGSLYAGYWGHTGMGSSFNEADLYIGYKFPLWDKYMADIGYTYYWYTQGLKAWPSVPAGQNIDFSNELYAGVTYRGLWVNPSVYLYYNFELEQLAAELSGKYSWDVSRYGLANTTFDVGAFVGGVFSNDANGQQIGGAPNNGYTYYGASADLVYAINKSSSASLGVRYAGNNDSLWDENSVWWGARFSTGF